MKKKNGYYKDLNILRCVACLAVLLYHLKLINGGFLAVCAFFVLSGYLSCKQAFKQKDFSFKDYYVNKFKNIYLPLLIMVLVTIGLLTWIPNIIWLNLKPETSSVLLGYNNFWQIKVNVDYFARHLDSPFMHLWYISILLQFEIVFPWIFKLFKKIGDKLKKWLPSLLLGIMTIASFGYFIFLIKQGNIMCAYYGTLARAFALLYGMLLGFNHYYYKPKVLSLGKVRPYNIVICSVYYLILIMLFILVGSNSKIMGIAMLITVIVSGRLITYAVINRRSKLNWIEKVGKSVANISYEIYLWQYPLIFLGQYIDMNYWLKIGIIIGGILVLSYWLNYSLKFKNSEIKIKVLKGSLLLPLIILSLYGGITYIKAKDYTEEMKALENQLEANQQMILKKQEEFLARQKKEEENWLEQLKDIEDGEKEIEKIVKNLTVVGIGDSVMLGAVENLYKQFPNGYFDAAISRTAWVAEGILKDLNSRDLLGDVIVINLGANGDCSKNCKDKFMNIIGERKVFWVNIKNNETLHFNETLEEYAKEYSNINIIDWYHISENHPEYFVADGIHLTEEGRIAYTKAIYESIYNSYLDEYKAKVEEIISNHEERENNKISFYGNDLLVNAYDYLQEDFENDSLVGEMEMNYDELIKRIEKDINNKALNKNVVFIFDKNWIINEEELNRLIKLCENRKIYFISLNEEVNNLIKERDNLVIINLFEKISEQDNYLLADKVHLSDEGNKALKNLLLEVFNKN